MSRLPSHIPVMRKETLAALAPKQGGLYLDGTVGLGGHASLILESAPGSQLCGLDRDADALKYARERLEPFGERVHLFHLPFDRFEEALENLGWTRISGALLDLGVSSLQLDTPERGFSFRQTGPLDMRMDAGTDAKSAWHLINEGSYSEIRDCLAVYGEEPLAGKIAKRIIGERQKEAINNTGQLADIIIHAYPPAWRRSARRHPATRAFQAFRMVVNDELGQLERFLESIPPYLEADGRLVIISFHSLEDRIVKRRMKSWVKTQPDRNAAFEILYRKPITPADDECAKNPRASSAKLRAALRIANDNR